MKALAENGSYELKAAEVDALSDFRAGWADEAAAASASRRLFEGSGYLVDPHTAVAVSVLEGIRERTGEVRPTLVTATASPFKFPISVARAIGLGGAWDESPLKASSTGALLELDAAELLAKAAGLELPAAISSLRGARELHHGVVDAADMETALEKALQAELPGTGAW